MRNLFEAAGLEVNELNKFHELSFPYDFYLRKLLHSEALVKLYLPMVSAFFWLFRIRNKIQMIGRNTK